ncbi:MAG: hypothetical protein KME36_17570 [Candidatus Thiodiazotropha sp. (ex Lucina pensylvanica)]|nr:hypothetical protein [Candidatus Thiodiazotropha sp. (ex Lucina pensylvanica)]MBT3052564.1 hypothetical protein [Candidatus Thiodiazotropha sp. (ex Codakia orbicularis)]
MKKQTLMYFVLMINLLLLSGCTSVVGTFAGWDGALMSIRSPANLGSKSVYGITWCTAPDRICQKSLRRTELKPGMMPGGGYSVFPDNKIRVPERIEVSWIDADGVTHQQVVELNIPGCDEVVRRYGAPRSAWDRRWDIVLIFKDDEPISYAWQLLDKTDRDQRFKLPKSLVYWGNRDVFRFTPDSEETVIRYEPEN